MRLPILCAAVLLSACATHVDEQQMSTTEAKRLVQALPANSEKRISLALMRHPDTLAYVDYNGFPAWRWRGKDDIGACVHFDPVTRKPYLETQYPRSERTSVPKYIDFGTDSEDWQCRIHVRGLGFDIERNWSDPACHSEGRQLLRQLRQALGASRT